MISIQTLENALQFLGRVQLQGNEVPAFVQVTNELHIARQQLIDAQSLAAATDDGPGEASAAPQGNNKARPRR